MNRLVDGDEERFLSLKASLVYYLRRDGEEDSTPCPAFPDRTLWLYPYSRWRVLYEAREKVFVWSVLEQAQEEF
ncbi:MAG: hypothetical protein ACK4TP_00650 [Hyphomicrobium sp.]